MLDRRKFAMCAKARKLMGVEVGAMMLPGSQKRWACIADRVSEREIRILRVDLFWNSAHNGRRQIIGSLEGVRDACSDGQ